MSFFKKLKEKMIGQSTEETNELLDVEEQTVVAVNENEIDDHDHSQLLEKEVPGSDLSISSELEKNENQFEENFQESQQKIGYHDASADAEQSIEKLSWAEKFKQGLTKTREQFASQINELVAKYRTVDEDFFEELEELLIQADVGMETVMKLIDELRMEVKRRNMKDTKGVQSVICEKLVDIYQSSSDASNEINFQQDGLTVILFVGVNGVGKTTTIGKLAHQFKSEGKKVLLAAGDTFRAGAIEQLEAWGDRVGVEVIKQKEGSDPAAVMYDAIQAAKSRQVDVLICDTAGRLQNKVNLMKELEKIKKVIQREIPSAPHEVLLVLDATTGQNALVQTKMFKEVTDVTGIVLSKLDGTAKGGIVIAIRTELGVPVKYVGLGEKMDDLQKFDPERFVYGLFAELIEEAEE